VRKATSAFQARRAYWVSIPLDGTTQLCGGSLYWRFPWRGFEGGVPVLANPGCAAPPATVVAMPAARGLRNGNTLLPPSNRMAARSVAPRLQPFHSGVLSESCRNRRFPGKIRRPLLGVGRPQSGSAWPWGRRWQLWRPPPQDRIWRPPWLCFSEWAALCVGLQKQFGSPLSLCANPRTVIFLCWRQGSSHPGCVHALGEALRAR